MKVDTIICKIQVCLHSINPFSILDTVSVKVILLFILKYFACRYEAIRKERVTTITFFTVLQFVYRKLAFTFTAFFLGKINTIKTVEL